MSAAPPRVCPSCREEYLATVGRCAECEVDLVSPSELPPKGELPPVEQLQRVRVENPVWIQTLASQLAQAGIASRIELLSDEAPAARRHGAPCALYVRPEDAGRAREIDEDLLRAQLPDLPEGASGGWSEAEGCPACGTAVEAEAAECPECGLAFAEAD
ncbi:MAG: hypothetical protein ABFS46_11000 [Myxococcota bacterium]